MYKNRATGFWEHDFRVEGVPRYHLSYGVTRRADAEPLHAAALALFRAKSIDVIAAMRIGRLTIQRVAELRAQGLSFATMLDTSTPAEPWPCIADAIADYLDALENNQNKSARTRQLAGWQLVQFTKFLEVVLGADAATTVRLDAITSRLVDQYQAHLIDAGKKTNTVTAYVSRVGSLFHWHRRTEERDARETKRPARSLHVPLDPETISRAITRRERFLSEAEAERLIAATPPSLLFPVAAALFGGFRIDEMAHFRTQHDVDLALGLLSVQRQPGWSPKTKRSVRHVPIATALRPILEEHLAHRASDEWVTPSASDPTRCLALETFRARFRRIVAGADLIVGRADPRGVTYHTLRHTFASWLLMRGTDVFTVAQLLGNTVEQVENTYGHLAKDFRQAAVDRLGGAIALTGSTGGSASPGSTATPTERPEGEKTATTNATVEGLADAATERTTDMEGI